MPPTRPLPQWGDIALRVGAAVLGGYGLTYAFTAALARLLPVARADAVVIATLLSFAVYTTAVLWAFAAASAWRAWWVAAVVAAPLALLGFWPPTWG